MKRKVKMMVFLNGVKWKKNEDNKSWRKLKGLDQKSKGDENGKCLNLMNRRMKI